MWFKLTQMIVLRPSLEFGIYRYIFSSLTWLEYLHAKT